MKVLSIMTLSLLMNLSAFADWDLIESQTGNHCKDQALNFLTNKYGGEDAVVVSKWIKVKDNFKGGKLYFWTNTNLCDGQIVFEYDKLSSCSTDHYGYLPNYLEHVWATGDCKDIVGVQYPSNDEVR